MPRTSRIPDRPYRSRELRIGKNLSNAKWSIGGSSRVVVVGLLAASTSIVTACLAVEHFAPRTASQTFGRNWNQIERRNEGSLINTAWFPVLPKRTGESLDPRKTEAAVIGSAVDLKVEQGIVRLTCPVADGRTFSSTMTLVRTERRFSKMILVGAGHGLISEETVRKTKDKGYSDAQLLSFLPGLMQACQLEVTNRAGTKVLEILKLSDFKLGTLYTKSDETNDYLLVDLKSKPTSLVPVDIKNSEPAQLVGAPVHIIAYHHDIGRDEGERGIETKTYHPRVKSSGSIRPMHPKSLLRNTPGVILHDVATGGEASGALIYDDAGNGVGIHLGGVNPDNGPYDGFKRYNFGLAFDERFYEILIRFSSRE